MEDEFVPFEELPEFIKQAAENFLLQMSPEELNVYEMISRELGVGYEQMIAEGLYLRYLAGGLGEGLEG